MLSSFFPSGWRELAVSTNATKGLRQDKDAGNLLRLLLMHVGCGYSLRETVTRAHQSGLSHMSDVALLKRLRKSELWLQTLCCNLFEERRLSQVPAWHGETIRLIDASNIKEPGKTGSFWRLHYSLVLPSLACDFFELTPYKGEGTGESLCRYKAQAGEHLIADRGYSTAQGIDAIAKQGAYMTVRLNPQNVRLQNLRGGKLDIPAHLAKSIHRDQCVDIAALLTDSRNEHVTPGRICALRKNRAAIALAQKKLRRRASKNGATLGEHSLFYAQYVIVFTTIPKTRFSASQILESYRLRWQIELVFKRFKQQADLGHLPKNDPASSRAWLYGKLFTVLLTEKLLQHAECFSPWGYEQQETPDFQPLEGVQLYVSSSKNGN